MKKFYFSYGVLGHPYNGGWTEIVAENKAKAIDMFRERHPDKRPGLINCADIYTEEEFARSEMREKGNFGAFCQEYISEFGIKTVEMISRIESAIAKEAEKRSEPYNKPIFEIMLFEKPNEEVIYPTGKHSGFPDMGTTDIPGFFYDLPDAIRAMHENLCDIKETVYDAGFILCHFPGFYNAAGKDMRMYFVWDKERQGYFEQEEPKIFAHIAY